MSQMPLAIAMASRPQPSQSMIRPKQPPRKTAEAGPDGNLMRTPQKRPIAPAVLLPRRKRRPWKRDSRVLLKKSRKKRERERRQKMQQLGLVLVALTTQKRRINQLRKRTMTMRLKGPEDFPRERRKIMMEGKETYLQNCEVQVLQLKKDIMRRRKKESIMKKKKSIMRRRKSITKRVKAKSTMKKKEAMVAHLVQEVKEVLQDPQEQEEHQQEKADMQVMTTDQEVVITPKQSLLAVLTTWKTPHPGRAHSKVRAISSPRTSTKLT